MEVRIYDNEFRFVGLVENHESLLWHRRYNEAGDFTLTAPLTPENSSLLILGRLVWVRGKAEAGVIESREIVRNNLVYSMTLTGRFLESYMDWRLINAQNFEGKTEVAMRSLIEGVTAIPRLQLGELQGYDDEVSFQAIYKNLLTYETNLAKSAAFGFRVRPDFVEGTMTFEVYKGVDHSYSQLGNTKVVFSDEYENLTDLRRVENAKIFYNVVIVGGEGEDEFKTYVTVGDTEATGLNRREFYFDASDVDSSGLTWAQYLEALKSRGREVLEEHKMADSFECTVVPNGNFIYGKDYDVGDIVTVKKAEWGLSADLRVTEVTEVYEHEIPSIELVLGTPLPETIKWEA